MRTPEEVDRLDPGISGLDILTHGGIPCERLTLVTGTAGSGKTIFGVQFLANGIAAGEPGVFVTFEERPSAVRRNFRSFGWDIEAWEKAGEWCFVDASPAADGEPTVEGEYDLAALVVRVRHAVEQVGAKRVAIDSTGSLVGQFSDLVAARRALFQIGSQLEDLGVTSVMTAERNDDYGAISRYGFEEFVADNVMILRNALHDFKRRRTVEVLKLRGGSHLKGEHLFTLTPKDGMVVVPQEAITFDYVSSRRRMSSGVAGLDEMSHGGFFDKSLVLVAGGTGTGKSLLTTHFVAAGADQREKAILFSFEESEDQLLRNATAWGIDLEGLQRDGLVQIFARAPEGASLEDHLLGMKSAIDEFGPDRVAIDSVSALQRIATETSFRDYLIGLSFHIKSRATLGMITATSDDLTGGLSSGALHLSTVADTLLLLQYVGMGVEVRRAITLLKMRGTAHDTAVREYRITDGGLSIREPIELSDSHLAKAVQ